MKQLPLYLLAFITLFAVACGGKTEEEIQEEEAIDPQKNPLGALVQMGENMKKQAEQAEKKRKEAEESGEPIEALHYEKLYEYLPEEIDGYERQEPTGGSMTMQGMSFSSAEVKFTNGDKNIKVALIDYNVAGQLYQMATAMWATGMKVDTPEEKAMGISMGDNINGWQVYKKKSRDAAVMMGIGGRFLLSVEANEQDDVSNVKDIAKSMDLDELAEI